jgi:hypothetical protein
LQSASTPFNRWHHRVAVFIACATLAVIIAGALVTSEDAGLSVPDWPTSYGHYFRLPPWVGGIVFEHSHRMIAFFTGVCTTVIAFWTLFVDRRRWMKALGFGARDDHRSGDLGGMMAWHFLPPAVSRPTQAGAKLFSEWRLESPNSLNAGWARKFPLKFLMMGIRLCSPLAGCLFLFSMSN